MTCHLPDFVQRGPELRDLLGRRVRLAEGVEGIVAGWQAPTPKVGLFAPLFPVFPEPIRFIITGRKPAASTIFGFTDGRTWRFCDTNIQTWTVLVLREDFELLEEVSDA